MRFELDSEVNALYIYIRGGEVADGEVVRTVEVEEGVNLDLDPAGNVIGMEFVDADEFPRFLKRHGGYLNVPIREEDIRNLVA